MIAVVYFAAGQPELRHQPGVVGNPVPALHKDVNRNKPTENRRTSPAIYLQVLPICFRSLRRDPDLSRAFWDLRPGRTRANLARLMTNAAERGDIKINDPFLAAEALFGLWLGFSQLQLILDGGTEQVRSSVVDRVDRGIDIFMRAHG